MVTDRPHPIGMRHLLAYLVESASSAWVNALKMTIGIEIDCESARAYVVCVGISVVTVVKLHNCRTDAVPIQNCILKLLSNVHRRRARIPPTRRHGYCREPLLRSVCVHKTRAARPRRQYIVASLKQAGSVGTEHGACQALGISEDRSTGNTRISRY